MNDSPSHRQAESCFYLTASRGSRWLFQHLALGLTVAPLAACSASGDDSDGVGFEVGATMLPGDNCRSCHGAPASDYPSAPNWTVAGTVFEGPTSDVGLQGVIVHIRDAAGRTEQLLTNEVGNFHTLTEFEVPYWVALEREGVRVAMPAPPPSGGCNACHAASPVGDAPGRLYVPQNGSYPSLAECDGAILTVGKTEYPCAPYACVATPGGTSAQCLDRCSSDGDCSGARCSAGLCIDE